MREPRDAYLAGIIDGEGAILLQRRRDNSDGCPVVTQALVRVMSTGKPLCEWLHQEFGGHLRLAKPAGYRPGCKALWEWAIAGPSAGRMLAGALPFLVLKREQAEIAISLIDAMAANRGRGRLTAADVEWRANLRVRLKALQAA